MSMYNNQCSEMCKNFINRADGILKCNAFPNGIPENIINDIRFFGEHHENKLPDQAGDYVFERNPDYKKV